MALAEVAPLSSLRALLLVGSVLVFRLLYAAIFATNPVGDEAYYWDWGRQLDYGYYSKPPFIAWLYAFVDWIGGGSLFAIRATAAVLGTLSLLILHRFATELFGAPTGWCALLLAVATPGNAALSFFLTIDAPLAIFWTIALWMFWRFVSERGGTRSLAILFGALALGHLCKQMMMVFPLLVVIFLSISPESRPLLRRTSLWFALLGSYLSLLPPLIWNARHDWITFRHTSHHFETIQEEGSVVVERLEDFLSFLGTQLGVLSPLTAFVVFSLCLVGLRFIGMAPLKNRFLLIFGALPLGFMLLLALRQELQPNWAAVFYLPGIVLAAGWYSGVVTAPFPPSSWRRLFPLTVTIGLLLVGYFYIAPPLFEATGNAGHSADPNRRLIGHDLVAREFEKVRRSLPESDSLFLVALGHRDQTSQLAFGLPDQPRVYRWESQDRISSQYEMWNNPFEDGLAGQDGLILFPKNSALSPRFARAFKEVLEVGAFQISFGAGGERDFRVFLGKNLISWPKGVSPTP